MDGNSIEFTPKWREVTTYEYDVVDGVAVVREETKEKFEIKPLEDKVLSVKQVEHDQVDDLIKAGYQPKDFYAKNVTMILTESANKAFMESLKEKLVEEESKQ